MLLRPRSTWASRLINGWSLVCLWTIRTWLPRSTATELSGARWRKLRPLRMMTCHWPCYSSYKEGSSSPHPEQGTKKVRPTHAGGHFSSDSVSPLGIDPINQSVSGPYLLVIWCQLGLKFMVRSSADQAFQHLIIILHRQKTAHRTGIDPDVLFLSYLR